MSWFQRRKAQCQSQKEALELDALAPARGVRSPGAEESSEYLQEVPSSFPRKPPQFDSLMNGIKMVTKKVDKIKGFKFDLTGAVSQNFNISHSWVIPNGGPTGKADMHMSGKSQGPSYNLSLQYLHGSLRQIMENPIFIMTGRWDSSGKLDSTIIKKFNDWLTFRLTAGYPTGAEVEYAQMFLEADIDGSLLSTLTPRRQGLHTHDQVWHRPLQREHDAEHWALPGPRLRPDEPGGAQPLLLQLLLQVFAEESQPLRAVRGAGGLAITSLLLLGT